MKRITRIFFPQRQIKPQGCAPASDHNIGTSHLGFISQQNASSSAANASSYPFKSRAPLLAAIDQLSNQRWMTIRNQQSTFNNHSIIYRTLSSVSSGRGSFRSLNFVQNVLDEDSPRQNKRDIVHILMKRKKTFVTVTDEQGNKKFGASAGSLEETKGRSRQSRYAAESTAEQVGRTCRKMGLKSVVIKVKGAVYFRRKRKVIMSWRDGFRGEGLGARTRILAVQDETNLAHNGCRLAKKRRV